MREVVIIDRDTKGVEVFALADGAYTPRAADAEGGLVAETLGVRFRTWESPPRLHVVDLAEPSASVEI